MKIFSRGTSWGGIPFPGVYSKSFILRVGCILFVFRAASYDYGAAIAENRALTGKYAELKRQGLFLRSSPEFYKTDWMGDTSTGAVTSTSSAAYITHLRNPENNASFYLVRNRDATSTSVLHFTHHLLASVESHAKGHHRFQV
jgi:hypothetical protein